MADPSPAITKPLPHLSINPSNPTTILLIHGAFSNKDSWSPLLPLLSEKYHLLIPTLPGHQEAASTHNAKEYLTFSRTSELLSQLVGIDNKVHVVGHSFGANVALHFAAHYPDQIASVFVSGTAGFIISKWTPYALWMDGIITYGMPRGLIEHLTDVDPSLRGKDSYGGWRSIELCTAINEMLQIPVESDERVIPTLAKGQLAERGARVLVVAATKRGVLPTDDNLSRTKAVADRLGGVAVEVPTMRHAWIIQDPSLFARVMTAWVEGEELPAEAIRV